MACLPGVTKLPIGADGLILAKDIDVSGIRTLGFFTKLDIMDADTDARKIKKT